MNGESSRNDELPGMLAVAKGVAEQTLPHTMDAAVWAAEYVKLNPGADEGLMLSWFANAIMAGYDTAQARAARSEIVPKVYQCPRCCTAMEVDPSAKPYAPPPHADTTRLDFLEGEQGRELDWRTNGKGDDFPRSLYRRNEPITRKAIDKAIAETEVQPNE